MRDRKYIVTGGGGFVGKALTKALIAAGAEVHTFARRDYPELGALGAVHHKADLAGDLSAYADLFAGVDTVFHTAAKVDMWGRYDDFYRSNVIATRQLLEICRSRGVSKFVYTSSPSVIAGGGDLCGVDERAPYPCKFHAFYPRTKAEAERMVCAANERFSLRTIALRPHLIFGPGDTNLVPTILRRAREGRMVQIGAGHNLTDITFIEDCVQAHLKASKALEANPAAAGRAYFISQGEPVNMWQWIREIVRRGGEAPLSRTIPAWLAFALAEISELIVKVMPGDREPFLTRFLVEEMTTSHYFDISAAKEELGYDPRFTVAEAMDITFA